MKFVYKNRKEIDEQYLHDSYFEGYQYDYEKRQLTICCIDGYHKKKKLLVFENVIFSEMQSCQFWAPGNSIYDIWVEDNSTQLKNLIEMAKNNKDKCDMNCISEGIEYIEIKMQINSGDTLFVICQSLLWNEEHVV